MTGRAFTIQIRPGTEEEYKRRHVDVWPEIKANIKKHGFFNYSIYLNGTTLFAYMEHDGDFDASFAAMQAEPIAAQWRNHMSDIIIRDENMGFRFLERVFRVD
ncbi:L-rhamnose mutarotase [Cohnella herbarum]|uniref:L-rhamnose mutarotase n=1 Tax=Cohnella herbarum TaxID=2728023 RepID=A0A7Z2VKY8_9BACL|nr:L-rhamnose mutarotase [Cohnella herbarum]QJD84987.1 L-rhamnose mutarotase [Cohnella herbarum]